MRRLLLLLPLVACSDVTVGTNNTPPAAAITQPAPDFEAIVGDSIEFRGEVEDATTPGDELEVRWSSSLDGTLFDGFAEASGSTSVTTDALSTGEHTITLRVADSAGASATDAIGITVAIPQVENTDPTCAITAPEDDAEFLEGETIVLEGTATDEQSDPTDLTATWSSSEDGVLGQATPSSSGDLALPVDDLSAGTHVLTLDVADPDGGNCSEFIIVTVVPANLPPSMGPPSITPVPLLTDDTATCTHPVPGDPENDPTTVSLRWLVESVEVGTGATLAGANFAKGDTVVCEATPNDGTQAGPPATSPPVVVADTPPTQPGAAITPAAPVATEDDLVCELDAAATDADGDAITYAVAWTHDGSPWTGATSTTTIPDDTIPAADLLDGTWECELTPTADGVDGPAGTATATVGSPNLPPSVGMPFITPIVLRTDDTATCNAPTPTDPEGDPVTLTYAWDVNGTPAGGNATTLASTNFVKGDSVTCTVTPNDGNSNGAPAATTLTVVDTVPTQPAATITPAGPVAGQQDLSCQLTAVATDADNEAITYAATWTINSVPWTGVTTTNALPGDTLPAQYVTAGVWGCAITPTAAGIDGPPGTATTVVGSPNQPPSVGAPTMSPVPLQTADTASCSNPAPTDPEGDAVTLTWAWTVNGAPAGGNASTLASTAFSKGQTVQCQLTPSDAFGTGAMVSASLVVVDTPPTQPTVAISPSSPTAGADDLVCGVAAPSTDPDGELVSYSVAWTLDSIPYGGPTATMTIPGDTILASNVTAGSWACSVTPTAASINGPAGVDSVSATGGLPNGKLVFVSSILTGGNMGGVTGADAICQQAANQAFLPGTYLAWLSTDTYSSSPAARFTRSFGLPYVRVDGVVVADDWNDLTDGTIDNPITTDEYGNVNYPQFIYSYTRIDGSPGLFGNSPNSCYGNDCHCDNWTSITNGTDHGSAVARPTYTNDDWTDYSYGNFCNRDWSIFCFQQ